MSEFIVTPTNVDLLESLFRNPLTGKWTIPFLTFNTGYKILILRNQIRLMMIHDINKK